MTETPLSLDALKTPPAHPSLLPAIRRANEATAASIVVLDDDPLGGQCLHDVPVVLDRRPEVLRAEVESSRLFLLVTDTRALGREAAMQRASEVGRALWEASEATGRTVTPVWRGDSTLRGHFYWEMEAFDRAFSLGAGPAPVYVFVPFFGDGGRYTIGGTQYVLQDGALTPAAATEFARDPAFRYERSYLPAWLESHSEGRFRAEDIVTIGLDALREGGPDRVAALLADAPDGGAVVVDATADADLEVLVAGLQRCRADRRYLCSGAAPFARVWAGMELRPLLAREELAGEGTAAGLIVVGSHAERTQAQVEAGLAAGIAQATGVALGTSDLQAVARDLSRLIAQGKDVLVRVDGDYAAGAEAVVAGTLDAVVAGLDVRPRYVLAKGGATASHIAGHSLRVSRAMVAGRLLPGVPVWRLGEDARWPGLPFVIFPGNVGGSEGLAEAITLLKGV